MIDLGGEQFADWMAAGCSLVEVGSIVVDDGFGIHLGEGTGRHVVGGVCFDYRLEGRIEMYEDGGSGKYLYQFLSCSFDLGRGSSLVRRRGRIGQWQNNSAVVLGETLVEDGKPQEVLHSFQGSNWFDHFQSSNMFVRHERRYIRGIILGAILHSHLSEAMQRFLSRNRRRTLSGISWPSWVA